MVKKLIIGVLALLTTMVLAACGGNEQSAPNDDTYTENKSHKNMDMNEEGFNAHSGHEGMNHSGSSDKLAYDVVSQLPKAEESWNSDKIARIIKKKTKKQGDINFD